MRNYYIILYFLFQIISESDTESPIIARRQQEPDWVSQIENIPSQNGYHTSNGHLSVSNRELLKHTPEFLEDVCFDFERTLERSKTKKRDDPPPVPPRNLRHVYGSAVVDSVNNAHYQHQSGRFENNCSLDDKRQRADKGSLFNYSIFQLVWNFVVV